MALRPNHVVWFEDCRAQILSLLVGVCVAVVLLGIREGIAMCEVRRPRRIDPAPAFIDSSPARARANERRPVDVHEPPVPAKCAEGDEVVLTLVADDAARSLAVLRANGRVWLVPVGEPLPDGRTLMGVADGVVRLRSATGEECELRPAARREGLEEQMRRGIRRVGARSYAVDRELLGRALAEQSSLSSHPVVLPVEEHGRIVGIRILSLRQASLLRRLGLRPGDIVHSVNSFDVTTPDRALTAYATLRSTGHLTVELTRRGRPLQLHYHLDGPDLGERPPDARSAP